MSYKTLLFLIFAINSFCLTQESQRSPNSGHYMYYFYSKTEDIAFKKKCDDMDIKYGGSWLLIDQDTVRFTQANDSLKLLREFKDIVYLGSGIEDIWTSKGVNTYIRFKEFKKP